MRIKQKVAKNHTMSYKIIGSPRSPFVRICRMFMIQNSIDCEFHVLNFVDDENDAKALAKESPINKVPILVDGGHKIFDSRVIVSYLVKKHGLRELSIEAENIVSVIYGCLDAGVILFLMKKDGFDIHDSGFFLSRNRERIPHSLEYLTPWASSLDPAVPGDWNYGSMSLFSFIYWAQARGVLELKLYPEMVAFMERFKNASGIRETGF